jgi:hypothetical protein
MIRLLRVSEEHGVDESKQLRALRTHDIMAV